MKAKVCPECGHWNGEHHQNCPEKAFEKAIEEADVDPDPYEWATDEEWEMGEPTP